MATISLKAALFQLQFGDKSWNYIIRGNASNRLIFSLFCYHKNVIVLSVVWRAEAIWSCWHVGEILVTTEILDVTEAKVRHAMTLVVCCVAITLVLFVSANMDGLTH